MTKEKTTSTTSVDCVVHTPGPWEAYYLPSAGWNVRMAQPRKGYDHPDPICSMAWWQFDKPGVINNEISGANAKLIAAAPEMHEAIQLAISCLAGGFEVETADQLAEKHPAAAGALSVLLPFAKPNTLKAIKRKVV